MTHLPLSVFLEWTLCEVQWLLTSSSSGCQDCNCIISPIASLGRAHARLPMHSTVCVYTVALLHVELNVQYPDIDCVCCLCRNYAIADYLQSQGYGETLDSFRRELDTVSKAVSILGLLN